MAQGNHGKWAFLDLGGVNARYMMPGSVSWCLGTSLTRGCQGKRHGSGCLAGHGLRKGGGLAGINRDAFCFMATSYRYPRDVIFKVLRGPGAALSERL